MKKRLYKITSMILAVMLLLSCFAPMTLAAEKTEAEVGASYTIYFRDSIGWANGGNAYCYMWNSETDVNSSSHGALMTRIGDHLYQYTTSRWYENVRFYGSTYGAQTIELTANYGYIFDNETGIWTEYGTENTLPVENDDFVEIDSMNVYLRNSAGWEDVYVYMWYHATADPVEDVAVEENNPWPADLMEPIGDNVYKYTASKKYDRCIFNDNLSQSPDLITRYGYLYDNLSHTWELYETPPTTAPVTTVAPTTEPIQKYVNIFGDINLDLVNDGTDVYSGTVELEAGSYSFRVDENGTQMCFGYTFKDSMSNVTYSSNYTSATTLNVTGGYYTFKYNSTTNRLSVSYVSYPTEEVTTPITEPVTTEEPTEAPTTIPVTEPTEPITTVPVTEPTEPITTAPVTEPITTEPITEPVKDELTVNATSNLFTSQTATYNSRTRELTVTYYIDSEKDMLNTQWELTYDPTVLTASKDKNTANTVCPEFTTGRVFTINEGVIKFNTYNLSLYDISSEEKVFARVVFDVNDFKALGIDETTINLNVQHLTLSALDSSSGISDMNEEVRVVYNGTYDDSYGLINTARIEFDSIEIPELIGDADDSGDINIHDATLIAKYLADYAVLDEGQLLVSDCDGDGVVTIKDVTCIQLYIADAVNYGNTGQKYA